MGVDKTALLRAQQQTMSTAIIGTPDEILLDEQWKEKAFLEKTRVDYQVNVAYYQAIIKIAFEKENSPQADVDLAIERLNMFVARTMKLNNMINGMLISMLVVPGSRLT